MKLTAQKLLPPKTFQFVAGDLALDFCNTVGGKRGVATREYLNTHLDLLSWCYQGELVDDSQVLALAQEAARNPASANEVLAHGLELREALYRIFAGVARTSQPLESDLARLNSELGPALGRLRLELAEPPKRFFLESVKDGFGWEYLLGPVARSAAELLTTPERLERVRLCEGDTCGWLFVDASKNHSRRWCDMRDCGNRAKVRRHRLKQAGRN